MHTFTLDSFSVSRWHHSIMYVFKRNGTKQPVQFDKITARIVKLCYGLNTEFVDPISVAQKVTGGVGSKCSHTARTPL